jgi:hypothetical protein
MRTAFWSGSAVVYAGGLVGMLGSTSGVLVEVGCGFRGSVSAAAGAGRGPSW